MEDLWSRTVEEESSEWLLESETASISHRYWLSLLVDRVVVWEDPLSVNHAILSVMRDEVSVI
jgi:hypothetical protein